MNINVQHNLASIFSLSKANPDVQHSNSNFYSFFHPKQISVSIYLLLFFFSPSISWEKRVIVDCTSPETALQIEALKSYKYKNLALTC